MPRQDTKGAPNWVLQQQHCNEFPDGGSLVYLTLTKLTGSETATFDNCPILRFTLCVNCSLFIFLNEIPDAYSKGAKENNCELQYASLVIRSFSMSRELFTVGCTWSIHWNEKLLKSCGVLLKCTSTSQVFFLVTIADLWLQNLTLKSVVVEPTYCRRHFLREAR